MGSNFLILNNHMRLKHSTTFYKWSFFHWLNFVSKINLYMFDEI